MILSDFRDLAELHPMLRDLAGSKRTTPDVTWARARAKMLQTAPLTEDDGLRIRVAHAELFPTPKDDDQRMDAPQRAVRPRYGIPVIP